MKHSTSGWSTTGRKNCGSSCKHVFFTMLMFARKEGLIDGLTTEAAYDKKLKDYSSFSGLATGDSGNDANMTFKHAGNQASGYAIPGEGPTYWAYNDLGYNLFWKALHGHVFTEGLAAAADSRLANPLQFQNSGTNEGKLLTSWKKSYGPVSSNGEADNFWCDGTGWQNDNINDSGEFGNEIPSCNGMYGYASLEDFARVTHFWMRQGKWKNSQLLPTSYFATIGGSFTAELPVSPSTATGVTAGDAGNLDYLNTQTFGTPYSHGANADKSRYWYHYGMTFNKTSKAGADACAGQKLYNWPNAKSDAFCSLGGGGRQVFCAIPSYHLVFVSNGSNENFSAPHMVGSTTSLYAVFMELLTKTVAASNAGTCY